MIKVRVRMNGNDDPLAGFEYVKDTRSAVSLLSVKLGSGRLDDALYSLAHPDAPDANMGVTHQTVVDELDRIGSGDSPYAEKARELSAAYATEYLN